MLLLVAIFCFFGFFSLKSNKNLFTGRTVNWNGAAIALYLIKSAYLLMSAWHLRNGFPSVLNRDILTRHYGLARLLILKMYYYKIFKVVICI